jgi:hypothetical protein
VYIVRIYIYVCVYVYIYILYTVPTLCDMMQLDYRPWVANSLIENVSVLIQCRNSVSRCPVMLFTGE